MNADDIQNVYINKFKDYFAMIQKQTDLNKKKMLYLESHKTFKTKKTSYLTVISNPTPYKSAYK